MDKCPIGFSGYTILGNDLWFFAKNFNGLYVLDILTGQFQLKGQVPFEPSEGNELYSNVIYWEEKLFLIPLWAHKMAVYDIAEGRFEAIDLPGTKQGVGLLFNTACLYCDEIFLFPMYDTNIIKINLRSFKTQIINQWASEIQPYLLNKIEPVYFAAHRVAIQEGKIFLPFYHAHGVLELDCETMDTHIHIIEGTKQKDDYGYREICEDKECFWLSPVMTNGMAVRWNRQNGHKDFFPCNPNVGKDSRIYGIIKINDDIYFKIFDKEEHNSEGVSQEIIICTPDKYFGISETERYLSIYIDNSVGIRVYNKETGQKKDYFPTVEYANTPLGKAFKENIVQESEFQTVYRLIDAIDTVEKVQAEETLIGEKIYQTIKMSEGNGVS